MVLSPIAWEAPLEQACAYLLLTTQHFLIVQLSGDQQKLLQKARVFPRGCTEEALCNDASLSLLSQHLGNY